MPLHSGDRLHDRAVLGPFGIEDVAHDQHMFGAVEARGLADGINRVETRLRKGCAHIGLETTIGFTELPIGGVDEFHDGSCPSATSPIGIALRMNAPNIGTVKAVSP